MVLEVCFHFLADGGLLALESSFVGLKEGLDLLVGHSPGLGGHLGIEQRLDGDAALRGFASEEPLADERLELLALQVVDLLLEPPKRRAQGSLDFIRRDRLSVHLGERLPGRTGLGRGR